MASSFMPRIMLRGVRISWLILEKKYFCDFSLASAEARALSSSFVWRICCCFSVSIWRNTSMPSSFVSDSSMINAIFTHLSSPFIFLRKSPPKSFICLEASSLRCSRENEERISAAVSSSTTDAKPSLIALNSPFHGISFCISSEPFIISYVPFFRSMR